MVMNDDRTITKLFTVLPDHPGLAGHFPGNPVVPGVAILDQVRQCLEEWTHFTVKQSNLKSVKFLSPVSMGGNSQQVLEIMLEKKKHTSPSNYNKIEFRCMKGQEVIVHGFWHLLVVSSR